MLSSTFMSCWKRSTKTELTCHKNLKCTYSHNDCLHVIFSFRKYFNLLFHFSIVHFLVVIHVFLSVELLICFPRYHLNIIKCLFSSKSKLCNIKLFLHTREPHLNIQHLFRRNYNHLYSSVLISPRYFSEIVISQD
jgi:hypothetical protein